MPAILRETISRWSDHGAARLGAALAFYAILALAPLVIFLVVVVSGIFGATGAEMRIVQDARLFLGKAGANVVSDLLASARNPAQGVIAIGLATLTLLLGASGVFSELRDSLNTVWDVKPADEGFRSMFARKLFSFVLVLAAGLLVLVSVLATTEIGDGDVTMTSATGRESDWGLVRSARSHASAKPALAANNAFIRASRLDSLNLKGIGRAP